MAGVERLVALGSLGSRLGDCISDDLSDGRWCWVWFVRRRKELKNRKPGKRGGCIHNVGYSL